MKVGSGWGVFGDCGEGLQEWKGDIEGEVNGDKIMLDNVGEMGDEDGGIGGYKVWVMVREVYGREVIGGGERFLRVVGGDELMVGGGKGGDRRN